MHVFSRLYCEMLLACADIQYFCGRAELELHQERTTTATTVKCVTWSWPTFDLWLFRAETLHLSRSLGVVVVVVGIGDTSTDLENVLAEPKTQSHSQSHSECHSKSPSLRPLPLSLPPFAVSSFSVCAFI